MQIKIITIDSPAQEIEIPYLIGMADSRELLDDTVRTVDGTLRSDTYNGAKRKITSTHKMVDQVTWRKIFNYLDSVQWQPTDVYFTHLGGTIACKINIQGTRTRGKRTSFSTDLRDLQIDFTEV